MSIAALPIICIFLIVNALIIRQDITKKRIPNQLLGILFLLSIPIIGYRAWTQWGYSIITLSAMSAITISISFALYYFWLWSAGDAKYLLVLSLFLPTPSIVSFVGNISLLTLWYLTTYSVIFYLWFLFRDKRYISSFFGNVRKSWIDQMAAFFRKSSQTDLEIKFIFYRIFCFLLLFFTLFVATRLLRQQLIETMNATQAIHRYMLQYPTVTVFTIGGMFFGILLAIKKLFSTTRYRINLWLRRNALSLDIEFTFSILFSAFLGIFITTEYFYDRVGTMHRLQLIFTLYLWLYLFVRVLYVGYRLVFELGEQEMIPVKELRAGDIVDKSYLVNMFGSQASLGAFENPGILSPDPKKYFEKLENPIDQEACQKLTDIYRIVNTHHQEQQTTGFVPATDIKILRTFPFGIYIFLGFIMTYVWDDTIFRGLIILGQRIWTSLHI